MALSPIADFSENRFPAHAGVRRGVVKPGVKCFTVHGCSSGQGSGLALRKKEKIVRFAGMMTFLSGVQAGTIEWDSGTGQLAGTLAEEFKSKAAAAVQRGFVVLIHPIPSAYEYRVKDPLRRPTEFVALIESLAYHIPAELARYAPQRRARFRPGGDDVVY